MGFLASNLERTGKGPSVDFLHRLECRACPLNKLTQNKHPHQEPTGSKKPLIYILGEAPSKEDDKKGEHFSDEAGKLLRVRLPRNLNLRFNNVLRTRPYKGIFPTDNVALECCRPSVERDIAATKPKAIFGFGNAPLKWVSGQSGINEWRGRRMPVTIAGHSCWFYAFNQPSYILKRRWGWAKGRGPDFIGSEDERMFIFDLQNAIEELDYLPPPVVHDRSTYEYGVEIYPGGPGQLKKVKSSLKWAMEQYAVGVDYETNAHRPYLKKSKILSVGISTDEISFAFALFHRQTRWTQSELQEIIDLYKEFLRSKARKIVHNLPFEQEWTAVKFGQEFVRSGPWDCTLMQASVLDERRGEHKDRFGNERKKKQGPLSLEFLCRQYFGFSIKGMYDLDRKILDSYPVEEVLKYNAPDAKYHFLLWQAQKDRLRYEGLQRVYRDSRRRIPTCVLTQVQGVPVNPNESRRLLKKYEGEIDNLSKKLKKLKVIRKFRKKFKEDFNPLSSDHVVAVLKDMLKRKEGYTIERKKDGTEVEKYSTDKDVLAKIDHPIAPLIAKTRNINFKKSTFLYINTKDKTVLWPDNKIHCVIHPGFFTDTFRLSSDDPNMQNAPKRLEGNREIRKQIQALPDHTVVTIDEGQIEARVFAMASKDKRYMKYLWDDQDIHMDWAHIIAEAYPRRIGGRRFLKDKGVLSTFRTDIKNQWTFPLFFGARKESAAEYLKIPIEYIEGPYEDFKEEFEGVFKWQEKVIDFYHDNGYVQNLCGHRRRGPMSRNEAINAPIQSTACEIVMSAMNRISEYAHEKDDPYFIPLLQVHDELIFMWPDKKLDYYLEFVIDKMVNIPFDFINVPLTVEVSMGKNLLDMKKVVEVSSKGTWKWANEP